MRNLVRKHIHFEKLTKKFQSKKKIEKIHLDSKKLINSFEIKKDKKEIKKHLIVYEIIFFTNLLITF